jgi:hypothetical protein
MDPYLTEFSATVFLATPPVGGWPARFAVVTACNEHGDRDAEHANQARTAELRKILDDAGIAYFPVTGCSPDLLHREPGFGAKQARWTSQSPWDAGLISLRCSGSSRTRWSWCTSNPAGATPREAGRPG